MSRHRAKALRGRHRAQTQRRESGYLPGLGVILTTAALLIPFGEHAVALDGAASPRETNEDEPIASVGPFDRFSLGDGPAFLPPPVLFPTQDDPEPDDLPLDEGEDGDDCGDGPDSVEDSIDQA